MRLEQLPPSMQAKVRAQLGRTAKRSTQRQATEPGLPLTCTVCGEVIDRPTEARLAAHQADAGHARFEWRPA